MSINNIVLTSIKECFDEKASNFLLGPWCENHESKKLHYDIKSYQNHLGLYSEDVDFKLKHLLGNFPQAYSHLAFISTALTLTNQKPYNPNKLYQNLDID